MRLDSAWRYLKVIQLLLRYQAGCRLKVRHGDQFSYIAKKRAVAFTFLLLYLFLYNIKPDFYHRYLESSCSVKWYCRLSSSGLILIVCNPYQSVYFDTTCQNNNRFLLFGSSPKIGSKISSNSECVFETSSWQKDRRTGRQTHENITALDYDIIMILRKLPQRKRRKDSVWFIITQCWMKSRRLIVVNTDRNNSLSLSLSLSRSRFDRLSPRLTPDPIPPRWSPAPPSTSLSLSPAADVMRHFSASSAVQQGDLLFFATSSVCLVIHFLLFSPLVLINFPGHKSSELTREVRDHSGPATSQGNTGQK